MNLFTIFGMNECANEPNGIPQVGALAWKYKNMTMTVVIGGFNR